MNIKFFFQFVQFCILIILYSCSDGNLNKVIIPQAITGLCSPIQLSIDGLNKIDLSDYFLENYDIDSVYFENEKIDLDSVFVELNPNKVNAFLSTLTIYIGNITYDILVKAPDVEKTTILFKNIAENVKIKGEFTNWVSVPMELEGNTFKFTKNLNPAVYQFCFVVDGKEQLTNYYDHVPNGLGGENCQIIVPSKRKDNPSLSFEFNEFGNIILKTKENDAELIVFYENQLVEEFVSTDKGLIPIIPEYSSKIQLSYLRAWSHSKKGYSKEVLIPILYGKPVHSSFELPRQAKHKMSLYNVFIDRFYDGESNNQPAPLDSVLPQAQFLGGDLKGLTHQINNGYFDSLAINSIWISPIVDQAKGAWGLWNTPRSKFSAYHGYWPISFTQINPAFGTKDDVKTCISTAHQKNINVLLDVIANHIHSDHLLYKSNPEYFTPLYFSDGSMNTEKWDEHRLTTWFDVHMPSFNHEMEKVRELLSDSLMKLIKEYQFDGFRHDATKHVPSSFWKLLTKKIKNQYQFETKHDFFQIGETYGSHELVGSYVNSGQLDAQFDFNVYDAIMKILCDDASFELFVDVVEKSMNTYGDHHLMGNISGNQDKGRSISYFGGDLKRDEDSKLAGWTREIGYGDEEMAFKKMAMMHVLNSTIPGIPVIYYGDEIGMPGGNDPDCRRIMKFKHLTEREKGLKSELSHLLKLRSSSMALIYGTMSWDEISENRLVYSRKYANEVVTIYLNKSKYNQEFKNDGLKFILQPYTYKILKDNS